MREWLETIIGVLTAVGFLVGFFYVLASVIEVPEKLIRYGLYKRSLRQAIRRLLKDISTKP